MTPKNSKQFEMLINLVSFMAKSMEHNQDIKHAEELPIPMLGRNHVSNPLF